MSILFDEQKRLFKLDTSDTSYVIGIYEQNYLLGLYYGAKIPDMHFDSFIKRAVAFAPANPVLGHNGFSPDTSPMEFSGTGSGDFRISAAAVRNADGNNVTDLRYSAHRIYKGKKPIPGLPTTYTNTDDEADTLEIDVLDGTTGALVTLVYTVFNNQPVMTRTVRVTNTSDKTMHVERLFSLSCSLPTMDYDLLTFYGRHVKERSLQRRALAHGIQGVRSMRGTTSHEQNSCTVLMRHGATEDCGDVYGFNLVYSGNFASLAECDTNGATRYLLGINPETFEWTLEPGDTFFAPEAVSVFTDKGLGEMSRIFHRFYSHNLIRGKYKTAKRPLLINSWEAAYFDFDSDKLIDFAKAAKELGIEMLVMDDGWFGKRNDDHSSLGDWYVNENKLVGGLKHLVDSVNAEGVKFGIWYEPEMISPDSDLFRAHPDWHVHVPNREPMQSRWQYVLDVSREDVRDNIWQQMYKVLSENNIEYVKWDFNRSITDAGSALLPPERQKEFHHRFVLGTYDLMNRLVTTFPNILFEGCSGGGGRFDPAILSFSPQIWASDNTDPVERLTIQFGTSISYPASTMGAHVSACGRTGYKTKGDVALWGTFGYELDPRKLTEDDKAIIRQQIADYHKYYDLIRSGDLYRVVSPFDNPYYAAWEFVAADKSEMLFTLVVMHYSEGGQCVLRFKGLDPDRTYTCEQDGETYSGAFLMNAGLNLHDKLGGDGESFTLHFTQSK